MLQLQFRRSGIDKNGNEDFNCGIWDGEVVNMRPGI